MTRPLMLCALLVACSGDGADETGAPTTSTPVTGTSTGGGTTTTTTTSTTTSTTSTTDAAAAMCARWTADRATLSEGSWSGSVASCDPGVLDATGTQSTLTSVNLYRWLADLDPVTDDPSLNASAQACSLMMDAANDIDHYPDPGWPCYTVLGDDSAEHSNLATTPAVAAIDLYMVDYGNSGTLGHRRWILSNWIGPIGVGGTSDYSCLEVIGGIGGAGPDWTAFPSPGPFPIEAMALGGWASVDEEGWSVQSDTISLSGAEVTVTHDGNQLPVATSSLPSNYGSSHALSIRPSGWATELGVYEVSITGIATPIQYEVEFVDCGT